MLVCFAEGQRAPFDFGEGESELVSGVTTEYGGVGFLIHSLYEYISFLFICHITAFFFFFQGVIVFSIGVIFILYIYLLIRNSLPRYRYDWLLELG